MRSACLQILVKCSVAVILTAKLPNIFHYTDAYRYQAKRFDKLSFVNIIANINFLTIIIHIIFVLCINL